MIVQCIVQLVHDMFVVINSHSLLLKISVNTRPNKCSNTVLVFFEYNLRNELKLLNQILTVMWGARQSHSNNTHSTYLLLIIFQSMLEIMLCVPDRYELWANLKFPG